MGWKKEYFASEYSHNLTPVGGSYIIGWVFYLILDNANHENIVKITCFCCRKCQLVPKRKRDLHQKSRCSHRYDLSVPGFTFVIVIVIAI
jgi:hypothetical protein